MSGFWQILWAFLDLRNLFGPYPMQLHIYQAAGWLAMIAVIFIIVRPTRTIQIDDSDDPPTT